MSIAIGVIEIHREYWIKKRVKIIERIDQLKKEGKKVEITALEMVLDTIQEVISDLSEMIDSLSNIAAYEESCSDLINNINK
jgi:hypothetical protein